MQSVPQSVFVSHTYFSPPLLMLAAPRIAGLLPANVPARAESPVFRVGLAPGQELSLKKNTQDTQLSAHRLFRTPDEMDADLYAIMERAQARYQALCDNYERQQQALRERWQKRAQQDRQDWLARAERGL